MNQQETRIPQAIRDALTSRYGDPGREAYERMQVWLDDKVPFAYSECLEKHLDEEHIDLIFDAFWQVLPFGTGGRRGRVGYGSNRMNPTTVAMTVQGHCNFLRAAADEGAELSVVIANDVRQFHDVSGTYGFLGNDHPLIGVSARSLAKMASRIYAANGITAWLLEPESDTSVLTTPELAFLIRELNADGGINLSASHNPPDDNGIKVYDRFGSQPVAPADQMLIDKMASATDVEITEFDEALASGKIRAIPTDLHDKYIARYVELYDGLHTPDPNIPITFTPMCGCAMSTVGDVLTALGFPMVSPPDQAADGKFPTIPFNAPNPEVAQATVPACQYAEANNSSIVLSSDPDADRVGLEVRQADGSWYHFDGNQIATVLCYFLMLDEQGPKRRGLVIETLVTNKILGEIVRKAGDSWIIDDLLVGFKYVADVLKKLGAGETYAGVQCRPDQLVFAAEESHGVIMLHDILDKDATPACIYLSALHQILTARGETMVDYYQKIIAQLGGYVCMNRSIMMLGAEGIGRRDRITESLRESPPTDVDGEPVRRIVDHWNAEEFGEFVSESDKTPRNVIQIQTDRFNLTIRPSGTEAKLKLYVQLLPSDDDPSGPVDGEDPSVVLFRKASGIANRAYNMLLSRIDVSLGESGLALPDIVDLDRKCEFESATVPQLRERIASGEGDLASTLDWLRTSVAAMTPGADPLPAIKDPVLGLCDTWAAELGDNPRLAELREWAAR